MASKVYEKGNVCITNLNGSFDVLMDSGGLQSLEGSPRGSRTSGRCVKEALKCETKPKVIITQKHRGHSDRKHRET